MPPEFMVVATDETGALVADVRVRVEYSDPVVAPDTATMYGFQYFHLIPGPARVTIAPPDGYAIADSSRTDTTVVISDSVGAYLAFVLKRAP